VTGWVLRRLLAAVPSLLAFALLLFWLLARAPVPAELDAQSRSRRWLDVPALYNAEPEDRPLRVESATARAAAGDESGTRALLEIGAAGLADLVASLDRLSGFDRQRVSRALAPLAFRMGLDDVADLEIPARADRYWRHVLEVRAPDLRDASIRRALRRHLADRSEPLYARQLREADTAALAPLIEALATPTSAADHEEVVTLAISAASRAGGEGISDEGRLRSWWNRRRSRYVEFDAMERLVSRMTETRFGRWVVSLDNGRLGRSFRTGEPVLSMIAADAPATLTRTALALACAYALGIPLAVAAAARRRARADRWALAALLALYLVPVLGLALLLQSRLPAGLGLGVSAVALSAIVLASVSRHARSALLEVARLDHVRTARALGIHGRRLWFKFVARPALPPIAALAALELPVVLGASLVAEDVLGLPGLGRSFGEALRALDVPWLMAFALLAAALQTLVLIGADVAQTLLDPRSRAALLDEDVWDAP
jgi:peptide/nickel transport system permease protein